MTVKEFAEKLLEETKNIHDRELRTVDVSDDGAGPYLYIRAGGCVEIVQFREITKDDVKSWASQYRRIRA